MAALDPSHVYINDARAEVLKGAVTAVREGHAVVMITGADGSGKTTLMHALGTWLRAVDDIVLACRDGVLACSSETTFDAATAACRLPARTARAADVESDAAPISLLLLDDADRLDARVLAGLKRWVGQVREGGVAMAMIMTITDRGRRARRTEDERIRAGVDCEIKLPLLTTDEVPAFVYHALQAEGQHGLDLFSDEALARLSFYGNGNPGRIARLCARVVAKAERAGARPIPQEMVKDVAWTLFVPQHLRKLAAGRSQPDFNGFATGTDEDDARLDETPAEPEPVRRPRPSIVPENDPRPAAPRRAPIERTPPQPAADRGHSAETSRRPAPIVMDPPVATDTARSDLHGTTRSDTGATMHLEAGAPTHPGSSATTRSDSSATTRSDSSATTRSDSSAPTRSGPGLARTAFVVLLALLIGGATGFALVRTGVIKAGSLDRAWRAVTVEGEAAVSAATAWIGDLSIAVAEMSDRVNDILREVGPLDDERYEQDRVAGNEAIASGGEAAVAPAPQPSMGAAEPTLKPPLQPVLPPPAEPAAPAKPDAAAATPSAPDTLPTNAAARNDAAPSDTVPPSAEAGRRTAPDRSPPAPAARAEAPPEQQPRKSSISAIDAEPLLARGDRMLELGDLASARLFYKVVAERGHGRAATLMGLTYDPVYFRQRGIKGIRPEPEQAIDWYRRAIALGYGEAEQRQRVLVSWLSWRAETGDAEAARTLQRLQ